MISIKSSIILCLACALFSCRHKPATTFVEVQAPGRYTLRVPSYMHTATDLLPGRLSCIQYANDSAEAYLFIIDTLRKNMNENSLRTFYDSMVVSSLGNPETELAPAKSGMLTSDSTLYTERVATLRNGIKIYYRIEVVASPKRFYYLQVWTKYERKEALKEDFDIILNSFAASNQ